jgi:hypothetical protein
VTALTTSLGSSNLKREQNYRRSKTDIDNLWKPKLITQLEKVKESQMITICTGDIETAAPGLAPQ